MTQAPSRFRVLHSPYVPLTDASGQPKSRLQPYPPMVNPCRLCPAKCCSSVVRVTLQDVLHFCSVTALPLLAAFSLEPSEDSRRGFRMVEPDRRFWSQDGPWPGFGELRLRHDTSGTCRVLKDVGGYARCGAYEARPMSCRLYPVFWEDEHGKAGPKAILCPAPFAVTPDVAEQTEQYAPIARRHWVLHEEVAEEWNTGEQEDLGVFAALRFAFTRMTERMNESLPSVVLDASSAQQRLVQALQALEMSAKVKEGT